MTTVPRDWDSGPLPKLLPGKAQNRHHGAVMAGRASSIAFPGGGQKMAVCVSNPPAAARAEYSPKTDRPPNPAQCPSPSAPPSARRQRPPYRAGCTGSDSAASQGPESIAPSDQSPSPPGPGPPGRQDTFHTDPDPFPGAGCPGQRTKTQLHACSSHASRVAPSTASPWV